MSEIPDVPSPHLLRGVPRSLARASLGLAESLPFHGHDRWNAYELSWIDPRGKPVVATGELRYPCESPRIVESKSLKLYLGSLHLTPFEDAAQVRERIARDLEPICGAAVQVRIDPSMHFDASRIGDLPGVALDDLALDVDAYEPDPALLALRAGSQAHPEEGVEETLHTHLLRSNCPVTGQPDWASLLVRYRGPAIDHAALLRYVISYRRHTGFHEDCVERIFVDVSRRCRTRALTVAAYYTRRGGLDINPFRSDFETDAPTVRLCRQ
jgi:7-cyano-7-deazaguanine reductase